jgi:nucleoside-diphosphate-sugar epimerase
MKVVITGGTGFLGLQLARRLLVRGRLTGSSGQPERITAIELIDTALPALRPPGLDERVTMIRGEVSDRTLLHQAMVGDSLSVFHLASVVSAGAEQDFDLALKVNLDGGLAVLETARAMRTRPRLVFTSSIAVFGGPSMPETVDDRSKITPMSTYGMTKAVLELLVNDYTRKNFIDGRGARLPTIIVRPGVPNKAASGFASGVFREPLAGKECVLPVGPEQRMVVGGYRNAVEGMIVLHEAVSDSVGPDRTINFPCLGATVAEMIECLKRVAGTRALGPIRFAPDPAIQAICRTWPGHASFLRARTLGLPADPDLDSIVRAYIEDFVDR